MKLIELRNGGGWACVDDKYYDYLNQFEWIIGTDGYCSRRKWPGDPIGISHLHREVARLVWEKPPPMLKHIDGIKTNNQLSNLFPIFIQLKRY
ncbi:MAG TPA: hypothetical protein VF077_07365 [Nitrospiraceae bacterium]